MPGRSMSSANLEVGRGGTLVQSAHPTSVSHSLHHLTAPECGQPGTQKDHRSPRKQGHQMKRGIQEVEC